MTLPALPQDLTDVLVVTTTPQVSGGGPSLELHADQLGPVSINRGRTRPGEPYGPDTCTVTFLAPAGTLLPGLGDSVHVALSASTLAALSSDVPTQNAAVTRFLGNITDLDVRLAATPDQVSVQLTAVNKAGKMGRRFLPTLLTTSRLVDAETDAQRADHLLDAFNLIGAFDNPAHDPGVFSLASGTLPAGQSAVDAFDELSSQTLGVLRWARAGLPVWHDANHRNSHSPRLVLAAGEVLNPAGAQLNHQGVTNYVDVQWGNPPATVTVNGLNGIDDTYRQEIVAFWLTSAAAATDLGTRLVARDGQPRWTYDALEVDVLRTLHEQAVTGSYADHPESYADARTSYNGGKTAALLGLDVGDPLTLIDLPTGPVNLNGPVWLEGSTETVTRDAWRLALTVTPHQGA